MNIFSRLFDRYAAHRMRKEMRILEAELNIHYSEYTALTNRAERRREEHGFMDSLALSFDTQASKAGRAIVRKEARRTTLEFRLRQLGRPSVPHRPLGPLE